MEATEQNKHIELKGEYEVEAIANFFIEECNKRSLSINPMKLQKLLYFAYGWYAAFLNKKLFDEPIQAWRYGPVIEKIYHDVKIFGNTSINKLIEKYDPPTTGFGLSFKTPIVKFKNEDDEQLLTAMIVTYGKVPAVALSEKTHELGSPWSIIAEKYNNSIPNGIEIPFEMIYTYFSNLKQKNDAK